MTKRSNPSPHSLKEELTLLYERRSALDRLIESLERYSQTLEPSKGAGWAPLRRRHAAASRLA